MGVDSDFITKPQVYHILKVLKDQEEEAILSGRREASAILRSEKTSASIKRRSMKRFKEASRPKYSI